MLSGEEFKSEIFDLVTSEMGHTHTVTKGVFYAFQIKIFIAG